MIIKAQEDNSSSEAKKQKEPMLAGTSELVSNYSCNKVLQLGKLKSIPEARNVI